MKQHFDAFSRSAANHVPLSPVSFLNRAATVFGETAAVVHGPVRRTWTDVHDRVRRTAGGLAQTGIGAGDTVTVLAPNCPEVFELHFAVPMSSGVLSMVNTRLEPETIRYIIEHSDSRMVIVAQSLLAVLRKALAQTAEAPTVYVIDADVQNLQGAERPYSDLLASTPFSGSGLPEDEWDAIALNYTSGTSGRPKGVVYHHRGAYLMALGTVAGWQVPGRPSYMSVVPMFHCNGWGHPWMMAITGGKVVFPVSLAPEDLFAAVAEEKVTHFGAAPIILQMLAESPAAPATRFDPPLQVMTAGAPPPPAVLERMAALGADVLHVYGLTETYGHITHCLPQDAWNELSAEENADRRARQGVAFPILEELRVVDRASGADVPKDGVTQGEIALRGNTVMKGYYKDPEATAEVMRGGCFWTGDAAVIHSDGYMQIRDRLKDVIISGGENVSSVEVEAVLSRHPDVLTAAVVAKADDKWGEVPCAVVKLREGAEPDEAAIIGFCRERLAGFKTPKSVIFMDIPKTSTGKIQKFKLRDEIARLE